MHNNTESICWFFFNRDKNGCEFLMSSQILLYILGAKFFPNIYSQTVVFLNYCASFQSLNKHLIPEFGDVTTNYVNLCGIIIIIRK